MRVTKTFIQQIIVLVLYILNAVHGRQYADKVLLISMDGFRWDYIQKANTPNFDKFAQHGVKASYINNTFITKTFPCHYSIATGLYEESHGIIGNVMYDPGFNETFTMGTKDPKWWNGGEPIWVTARKNGKNSAAFFWPGSESKIHGYYANIWKPYDKSVPFKTRVDTVIKWLTDPCHVTNVAVMYFHEPDATGHEFGPDSMEVQRKVTEMDGILGYLMDAFEKNNLWKSVNVIVTSDHGMTEIDFKNKVVDISDYVNMKNVITVDFGPIMQIIPHGNITNLKDEIFRNLSGKANFTIYKKEDIPDFWHYKNNRRVMPLFAVADEGWTLTTNRTAIGSVNEHGAHGYDNRLNSMKPIFYARGPNFVKNQTTEPFMSLDIYPMICELLGIQPSANNGSLARVKHLLVKGNFTDVHAACSACGLQLNSICLLLILLMTVMFKI